MSNCNTPTTALDRLGDKLAEREFRFDLAAPAEDTLPTPADLGITPKPTADKPPFLAWLGQALRHAAATGGRVLVGGEFPGYSGEIDWPAIYAAGWRRSAYVTRGGGVPVVPSGAVGAIEDLAEALALEPAR